PLEIILENTEPPLVFVPDQTAELSLGLPFAGVEEDRTLFFVNRVSGSRRYVANIILNPLEVQDSRIEDIIPDRDVIPFMSTAGIPPRVHSLAESLASGSKTISQSVNRAMNFIQRQCSYSLEQPDYGNTDPVDFFLFDYKAGSCEHFASGLVLILRAMGIPARPVNGYTMGDWNDVGKFYTVRQGHAHTWVEVFFPNSGWVPYDPTPVLAEREVDSEVERFLLTLWETFEGYWFSYVFSFDNRSQSLGFKKIFSAIRDRFDSVASLLVHKEYLIILLLFVLFFRRKFRFMFRNLVKSSSWIPLFYLEWETHLPINRKPSETPSEFHHRLLMAGIVDEKDYANLKIVSELINEAVFKAGSDARGCLDKASAILGSIKAR
ncbi:MAG: transglutaminase-like domain-containing protein, partial [Candidatus Riflebacteria bacterium]|nr:transglutaminase-like domain-containing protein [Candidatus Riflebacteria bacterium]